tara:strand:- start:646 stop:780 length:135 start_codon:yes stop_codon:yes gene_type:complete
MIQAYLSKTRFEIIEKAIMLLNYNIPFKVEKTNEEGKFNLETTE